MNTHQEESGFGKNGSKSRYRYITLVAPMVSHDTLEGRQHNMKLYHVLRWFLYNQPQGSLFHAVQAVPGVLPYGGQCLRARCDKSRDAFLTSVSFSEIVAQMKEERLTPCLYMFDGFADGADKVMDTINISGHVNREQLMPADIVIGRSLNLAHVPTFARQILLAGKRKNVESISCDESDYKEHFGI